MEKHQQQLQLKTDAIDANQRNLTPNKQNKHLKPCRSTVWRSWLNHHQASEEREKVFVDTVVYRKNRLIKKSARYEDEFTKELNKIKKKTAVQMKDRAFSEKDPYR